MFNAGADDERCSEDAARAMVQEREKNIQEAKAFRERMAVVALAWRTTESTATRQAKAKEEVGVICKDEKEVRQCCNWG